MGASRFVGRVGGLAVALGVGAAWFSGAAASADSSTDSTGPSDSRTQSAQPTAESSSARPGRTSSGAANATGTRSAQRNDHTQRPARLEPPAPRPAATLGADTNRRVVTLPAVDPPADKLFAVNQNLAPTPAPADSTRATAVAVQSAPATAPVDSPVSWALLAAARRQPLAASTSLTTPQATVQPTTQATVQPTAQAAQVDSSLNSITVAPAITWGGTFRGKEYPGVLVGTLNAFSPLPLTYTTISAPSRGGKLGANASAAPSDTVFGQQGEFFYLPYATALTTPGQTETFKILVAQQTQFNDFLAGIPIVGLFVPSVLTLLYQTPILSDLLAPLIGASEVVTFEVSPYTLADGRPTAFTVKVPSFDGLMISTNYFPATAVALELVGSAPTVLNGPGLGAPGNTDVANPYAQLGLFPWAPVPTPAPDQFGSLTPGLPVLRDGSWISTDGGPSYTGSTGYNVITWDPRGEFATRDRSLPGLQIDNPFFEGRDASELISWAYSDANPARSQVAMETPDDPLIGMVGGSYGGGIQWVTAGQDPRVDTIVPQISWNSLISSLYPNENQFKTGFGTVLLLALVTSGANINTQIYRGIGTGVALGWLSQRSQAVLSSAGPTVLVGNIGAPTLIFQGMQDVLFQLQESVTNAQTLPGTTPVKMVWFCGGHGTCTDPLNPYQDDRGLVDNLKWLDQYLAGGGTPADTIPNFQWYDQRGGYHTSTLLPFQDGFNLPDPYSTSARGGLLGLFPILGGSGPESVTNVSPVLSIGNATPAWNALNVNVTPPAGSQIVGAPTLSLTYAGLGSSRTVYAQLIDNATGRVLGNLVTPVPVVLDGRERTLSIPMANIGYTTPTGGSLTLQITSSASNFENFTTAGIINISGITIDLPIRDMS